VGGEVGEVSERDRDEGKRVKTKTKTNEEETNGRRVGWARSRSS
jgi:hypothetical protein